MKRALLLLAILPGCTKSAELSELESMVAILSRGLPYTDGRQLGIGLDYDSSQDCYSISGLEAWLGEQELEVEDGDYDHGPFAGLGGDPCTKPSFKLPDGEAPRPESTRLRVDDGNTKLIFEVATLWAERSLTPSVGPDTILHPGEAIDLGLVRAPSDTIEVFSATLTSERGCSLTLTRDETVTDRLVLQLPAFEQETYGRFAGCGVDGTVLFDRGLESRLFVDLRMSLEETECSTAWACKATMQLYVDQRLTVAP
jgi:hypothetical protein